MGKMLEEVVSIMTMVFHQVVSHKQLLSAESSSSLSQKVGCSKRSHESWVIGKMRVVANFSKLQQSCLMSWETIFSKQLPLRTDAVS